MVSSWVVYEAWKIHEWAPECSRVEFPLREQTPKTHSRSLQATLHDVGTWATLRGGASSSLNEAGAGARRHQKAGGEGGHRHRGKAGPAEAVVVVSRHGWGWSHQHWTILKKKNQGYKKRRTCQWWRVGADMLGLAAAVGLG